jgi:ferredoxin
MKAITIIDEVANIEKNKCIGCGLCVTGCPEQALLLQRLDSK